MRKWGSILVLSGPSGVGKSTVVGKVRERYPELEFSISCTTRSPRPGEIHGVHYYFLSQEEFAERVERSEFIEHAHVFANRYGTLKSEVMARARAGKTVLLDIDVQGAMNIREAAAHDEELARCCDFVFIAPPSLAVLERRLRGRSTDSEEQIALRLGQAKHELSFWNRYDYVVVNDDLDEAVVEFDAVIHAIHAASKKYPKAFCHE